MTFSLPSTSTSSLSSTTTPAYVMTALQLLHQHRRTFFKSFNPADILTSKTVGNSTIDELDIPPHPRPYAQQPGFVDQQLGVSIYQTMTPVIQQNIDGNSRTDWRQ
jgi:hypothetical protein